MQVLLGVAIGLALMFAVVAVVVSSTMEVIAAFFRMRSRSLMQGIARLLDDQRVKPRKGVRGWLGVRVPSTADPATQAVLQHPLIRALSSARGQDRPPSYIDAITFATAFLGSTIATQSLLSTLVPDREQLDARIKALPPGDLADAVQKAWAAARQDPTKLMATLLADGANGAAGIAALLGSSTDVETRLAALEAAGDPASAPLADAWAAADHDVTAFVTKLDRPDLMTRAAAGVDSLKEGLDEIGRLNPYLGKSLASLWERSAADVTKFRHEIEDWFDREMARVSGWYSRWSQWIMIAVALVIVSALNISAVTVGKALWLDPTIRDKAVAVAEQDVSPSTTVAPPADGATTPTTAAPSVGTDTLNEIGLPIGWNSTAWPGLRWYLVLHLLGIVLVAIAASFGAPFWFDALNRLVNLRTSGKPPATAAEQRAAQAGQQQS